MKQRILLLLLAVFLVGTTTNAQIVTSKSKLVTKVKKKPFEKTIYLAGGGKLNTLMNSTFSFKPGYEAAFGYEQNFKRNKKFGSQFGFEAGITTIGYDFDQPKMGYNHSESAPVICFSPFTYSYRVGFGKNKKTWFEPYIGPRVGIGFLDDHSGYWDTGHVSYEPYFEGYENERGFDTKLQVGMNIGFRLWLAGRVSIDLSYQQGFNKVAEEEFDYHVYTYNAFTNSVSKNTKYVDEEGRTSSICLRIGIKLNK